MSDENEKTKVLELGEEVSQIEQALKEIPKPEQQDEVVMVTEVGLDDLTDEEFLSLYGDGEETKQRETIRSSKSKFSKIKGKKRISGRKKQSQKSICKRTQQFFHRINDEELNEDEARATVKGLGIAVGILFIIVVAAVVFFIHAQYTSYSSQYKKAIAYEELGDTAKAAGCYEKAIAGASGKEDKIQSRMALANLYLEQHSDNNAAYYLEQVVDIDNKNTGAIKKLLSIYESNNDMASILNLAKKAEGEEAKALFSNYLLNQPVFNYKSGTYNEAITVEIEAGESERIYYTMDDSEATTSSMLYTGPITLQEGYTVFHAMAVNHNGLMSENIVVNYEVVPEIPQKPVITPESGAYREMQKIEVKVPDGCRAYYTFDGSVPTIQSPEYTQPISMPLGNHIFSVVLVSQNGLISEVNTRVYDFIYSTQVTKNEAIDLVIDRLIDIGELVDTSRYAADTSYGMAEFTCDFVISVNDTEYYRIDKTYSDNGPPASYAVQIDTGAVFGLMWDAYENYQLLGL